MTGLEDVEEVRRKPVQRRYKIQEVIKKRQILLVQVVKEERGNKGAALTTYLSLAGRYCVLMPNTARGGGISRKIPNHSDRKKLKKIMADLDVPKGMGCIIRTAGASRTKTEIKRDYTYLIRLWESIRDLTLKSIAPALIYEEGDLIKRAIRDMYSSEIEEVFVEGANGYRDAKDFMKMLMPSHAKRVQQYKETIPLFHRYQVEGQLETMYSASVPLKSGGYLVINPTEALVAIDVNSGRSTRERNIEKTAHKTNLEAAQEVARQLRLRDLAGLIVIDFIDMEDNRNNRSVERKMKECLKTDRARLQVGRISPFGLMEMSRQRLRPGLLEASTEVCPVCGGTGAVRSVESSALQLMRVIEEEGIRGRSKRITIKVPSDVAAYLFNHKRHELVSIEDRFGIIVQVEADASLHRPNYELSREGQGTGNGAAAVVTPDEKSDDSEQNGKQDRRRSRARDDGEEGDGEPRKRRRRGRRGGRRRRKEQDGNSEQTPEATAAEATEDTGDASPEGPPEDGQPAVATENVPEWQAQDPVPEAPDTGSEAEDDPMEAESPDVISEAPSETDAEKSDEEAADVEATAETVEMETDDAGDVMSADTGPDDQTAATKEDTVEDDVVDDDVGEDDVVEDEPDGEDSSGTADQEEASENEGEPEPVVLVASADPDPAPEPDNAEEEDRPRRTGWWNR